MVTAYGRGAASESDPRCLQRDAPDHTIRFAIPSIRWAGGMLLFLKKMATRVFPGYAGSRRPPSSLVKSIELPELQAIDSVMGWSRKGRN